MHVLRLIAVTALLCALSFYLGREIIVGLKTGVIRYAGGHRCHQRQRPVLFWMLVALFICFIATFIWAWLLIVFPPTR